ncbi:hypothetical protein F1C76_08080 [Geodermatophilaceae bacterium NBWT11]|nr:hypothetical protein F1C76_08080 [Geodermatophilaceae bacterium NBWT11]
MSFDVSAVVEQVRDVLERTPRSPVSVVAIDGPGGSGKTTLAALLAEALGGAPVVHTDHFATPASPLDWWPRVIEEVLSPLREGKPVAFRPYDWAGGRLDGRVEIKPVPVVILEGVSASRLVFRPFLAYSIWIDTPRAERLARGIARDGEASREQWAVDMAHEDAYMARERPEIHADLILSGASASQ